MRTSTSPALGPAGSTSCTTSGRPNSSSTAARIFIPVLLSSERERRRARALALALVVRDGVHPLQRQADVVVAAQQPVANVLVDLELDLAAGGQRHDAALEVDRGDSRCGLHQLLHVGLGQLDRQQPVLAAIGAEDVGERRGDDGAEAAPAERPGGVLARRPATEVGARDEDRRALELRPVEREVSVLGPVPEQELAIAGALDALEELLGDDL